MTDKSTELSSASGWPGGWYIHENGQFKGPYSAAEAFQLEAETADGKPRLVSRKGFSQWYVLKDLSEIFRATESLGRQVAAGSLTSEAQLAALVKHGDMPPSAAKPAALSARPAPQPAAPFVPKTPTAASVATSAANADSAAIQRVKGRRLELGNARPPIHTTETPNRSDWSPYISAAAVPIAVSPVAATTLTPPMPATAVIGGAAAVSMSGVAAATSSVSFSAPAKPLIPASTSDRVLMREYFLARGRLHLGKLKNPWITAFVGLPLTLGMVWVSWFNEAAREVAFHGKGENRSTLPSSLLALIPLFHFRMVYQLAAQIHDMEKQNRYGNTSPALATWLAIFPPLSLAYMQRALNRHWMLHARHAAAKRQGAELL